jgi:iron complex outermembrane receptor protein
MRVRQAVAVALWSIPATVVMTDAAFGQTAPQSATASGDESLETVIVTGSHIRRTDAETPTPLQVITAEEIRESGFTSTQDILHNLTANGQGTLSQGFSGAFASGAAGVALRGLNVGYTLTLIDGHRMAPYPIGDDGQRSFVDVANLPFDAIERVEVLKDGASAVYGSEAVAGVVNIILKKSYEGASITADAGTSSHADGNLYHVSGIWGTGNLDSDRYNFYVSAEYRQQQQIRLADRSGIFTRTDFTPWGGYDVTPGVQNDLVGTLPRSGTGYVTDADGNILGFMPGCDFAKFNANQCVYHDTWDQIQVPTKNYNFVGKFTQMLPGDWKVSLQGTYFESKAQQVGRPEYTFAGGYQGVASGPGVPPTLLDPIDPTTIPSTNPSYPAGTGTDVAFLRYTFFNLGPRTTNTDAKSTRAILELDGKAAGFDVDFAAGFTEVKLYLDGLNYVNPLNLQTALNSTTDPFLVGQPNSAAVNAFVSPVLHAGNTSKLSFGHVGLTRSVFDLPGGPLGIAFGADYFQRKQDAQAPALVAAGYYQNAFSNNFTVGLQQVASGYFELVAPIVKQFELDAAVRYDHYNISGGKASPKVGFKYTPVPQVAIRGTAAKGFRAPNPAENGQAGQTFFASTFNDPILCQNPDPVTTPHNFVGQCNVAPPFQQSTNAGLKPETSKSFTLGVIYEPIKDFSASADIWYIKIDNQIVSGGPSETVRGNNFAPLPEYQDDGSTKLVTPPAPPIAYITTSYINANSTQTDGLDLGFQYKRHFEGLGDWKSEANWSYTRKYNITIDGTTFELAGTHGPFLFSGDTGNPKSRVQWSNTFGRRNWSITGTLNYISSFSVTDPSADAFGGGPQATCVDALTNGGGAAATVFAGVLADGTTVPANASCTVGHFTTFDIYGRWDVTQHLNLHASVLNATNTHIPYDWATYAAPNAWLPYNPSLHQAGAVGPFFNLGVTYTF